MLKDEFWEEEPVLTKEEILQAQVIELLHNYKFDIQYYMQTYLISEQAATEMFLNEIRYADKMVILGYKRTITNKLRKAFFATQKMPTIDKFDKMDEEQSYEIFQRFYGERHYYWERLLNNDNWSKANDYAIQDVKALTHNPYANDNADYGYIYLALLNENAKENFIKNHTKKNS